MLTSMVFFILIAAQFFGIVFRGLGGDSLLEDFIANLQLEPFWILASLMLLLFVLGFFLDFLEICFIVLPIILPVLLKLEYNILWVTILIAINLQTSFLTPPFGFALFYLKGVTPPEIKTSHIYKGVAPFILIQLIVLLIIAKYPDLALWLPAH